MRKLPKVYGEQVPFILLESAGAGCMPVLIHCKGHTGFNLLKLLIIITFKKKILGPQHKQPMARRVVCVGSGEQKLSKSLGSQRFLC